MLERAQSHWFFNDLVIFGHGTFIDLTVEDLGWVVTTSESWLFTRVDFERNSVSYSSSLCEYRFSIIFFIARHSSPLSDVFVLAGALNDSADSNGGVGLAVAILSPQVSNIRLLG